MGLPDPVPLLTASVEQHFVPHYFFHQLCNLPTKVRKELAVTKITWFKESSSSEHEFLIAQVERPSVKKTVYLLVERAPAPDAKWKQVVSTSSPPSLRLGDVNALDTLQSLDKSMSDDLIVSRSAYEIAKYTFSGFTLLEFARIIHIISEHRLNYTIGNATCYWYASLNLAIARRHFRNEGGDLSNQAGRFKGIQAYTIDVREVAEVSQKYLDAWNRDPEPVGQQQQELRAERERRRAAEEREREVRREAGEREREARREAGERERELREAGERERELRAANEQLAEEMKALRMRLR